MCSSDLLVSMIDIFTTLVFFLLIATTNVVTLRNPNSLTLPSSISMEPPRDTPVLEVTKTRILLQGKPIPDLEVVRRLARRFEVSQSAMEFRLANLGMLTPALWGWVHWPLMTVEGNRPAQQE